MQLLHSPCFSSHRVNCLRGLEAETAFQARTEINTRLSIDPESVPTGLVPAVNEIYRELGLQPVGTALPPLPTSETASLAHCEVLSQIARQAESLIVKKNGMSELPFIARLCGTFPQSRIIVTVQNKPIGIEVVNLLRSQGHDCWFLDKDYKLREGQDWPNHRIRIVLKDTLWLTSLDIHQAEIVLFTDAAYFVRNKIMGFDPKVLFDIRFGTHFKEDARLVGIISEDAPLQHMRAVWSFFGLRTYQLNTQGEAYLAPRVTWITRSKKDRSLLTSGLTKDSTNREKMKALVWENLPRNKSVLASAKRLQKEAKHFAFVQERFQGGLFSPVAIVVENNLHKKEMYRLQEGKPELIPVMAFEDIAQRTKLPSFLVRADAGTGLLPLLPQEHGIWVLDVADQTSRYLSRRAKLRHKAYLRSWHVGEQPFVSKWLAVQ